MNDLEKRLAEMADLITEINAHPKSELIYALAEAMHEIEDDDGNGRHISYYQSLAYATVEILPGLFYNEDATCDEPGCGTHPPAAIEARVHTQPIWAVDHPGLGILGYDTEADARLAAGTAGTLLRATGPWVATP